MKIQTAFITSIVLALMLCDFSSANEIQCEGEASYYGDKWKGTKTASGEPYDPSTLTAAHRTLPFGTWVEVTNKRNGKSVVVRINNRGPWIEGRIIDLSKKAAEKLQMIERGVAPVTISIVE